MGEAFREIYILKKVFKQHGVPSLVFHDRTKVACIPEIAASFDFFYYNPLLQETILDVLKENDSPIIYVDDISCVFGGFCTADGMIFVFGPVFADVPSESRREEFRKQYHISDREYRICESSLGTLSSILSLTYYVYCGGKVDEESIPVKWKYSSQEAYYKDGMIEKYQLEKAEDGWLHDSFEHESMVFGAVEDGDLEQVRQLIKMDPENRGRVGIVADDNRKQVEYLSITGIVLASRAAIRGGMNPEEAYDLSDLYLQRIARAQNTTEYAIACVTAIEDFTERVALSKSTRKGNIYVEQCKDYIAKHLRNEISIQTMASILEVNSSYLSRIFSEQMGVTIQRYIVKTRCEHAASMLKYSDFSIAQIAAYFGFSSQSHFGKRFKEVYGLTPNEYRNENRQIGSIF